MGGARAAGSGAGGGAVVVVIVVVALALGLAAREARAERKVTRSAAERAKAFAPFDAGDPRPVTRGGAKGKSRRAHPFVGAVDKVPGDGPPPPPLRVDPDIPETALERPNAVGGGLSSNPLYLAALTYQHVLTKLDGPRCSHLPTCSRFASQAVARHGAVGILMGLDRLIQPNDSSAIRKLPEIEGWGGVRVFDPVDNYEFWKPDRFTGFPAATPEQPLELAAPPAPTPLRADAVAPPPATAVGAGAKRPSDVARLHKPPFASRPDAELCKRATLGGVPAPALAAATAAALDACGQPASASAVAVPGRSARSRLADSTPTAPAPATSTTPTTPTAAP